MQTSRVLTSRVFTSRVVTTRCLLAKYTLEKEEAEECRLDESLMSHYQMHSADCMLAKLTLAHNLSILYFYIIIL